MNIIVRMSAPKLRLYKGKDVTLAPTSEAKTYVKPAQPVPSSLSQEDAAKIRVKQSGGDPDDQMCVLGQHTLVFGKYFGQTFKWLLENDVGWIVRIITSHRVRICRHYLYA